MEGYIKLSRRFFSNVMWNEARTFSSCEAWLDLIQSARFEATPRKVSIGGREVSYNRGQFPASIRFLASRWQWSEKKVRSFLNHLKKEGMITTECAQGMNIITLCKYDKYNDAGTPKGTPKGTAIELEINELRAEWAQLMAQLGAHHRETGHTEGTNTNKGKEIYKETSTDVDAKKAALSLALSKRRDDFLEILRPYVNIYGREMMNDFFAYWTEPNKSGTKMRFELERTWDVGRRLKRWANHENQYSKSYGTNRENNQTAEQRAYGAAQIVAELLAEDDART